MWDQTGNVESSVAFFDEGVDYQGAYGFAIVRNPISRVPVFESYTITESTIGNRSLSATYSGGVYVVATWDEGVKLPAVTQRVRSYDANGWATQRYETTVSKARATVTWPTASGLESVDYTCQAKVSDVTSLASGSTGANVVPYRTELREASCLANRDGWTVVTGFSSYGHGTTDQAWIWIDAPDGRSFAAVAVARFGLGNASAAWQLLRDQTSLPIVGEASVDLRFGAWSKVHERVREDGYRFLSVLEEAPVTGSATFTVDGTLRTIVFEPDECAAWSNRYVERTT